MELEEIERELTHTIYKLKEIQHSIWVRKCIEKNER